MTDQTTPAFPTILDAHMVLGKIIEDGNGDLPIQLIAVPNETIDILSKDVNQDEPAIMMEFLTALGRAPVSMLAVTRMAEAQKKKGE